MNAQLQSIAAHLRAWRLGAGPGSGEPRLKAVYKGIFVGDFYRNVWDEPVLLELQDFIRQHPPDQDVYSIQLEFIRGRTAEVSAINDLFAALVFGSMEEVSERLRRLAALVDAGETIDLSQTMSSLQRARRSSSQAREKLSASVALLSQTLTPLSASLRSCFEAVEERYEVGAVNGLLITEPHRIGMVISIRTLLQSGSGDVKTEVASHDTFRSAVGRAREALQRRGWLGTNQDIIFSAEVTDATYSGSSITLPAAMAMYSSAREWQFDPYTAFTGDINIRDGQWRVSGVEGIPEKLSGAQRAGIRRVVLPAQNEADVPAGFCGAELVFVDDISEILSKLTLPQDAGSADTLQEQKVSLLKTYALARGWQVSAARQIQDGLQLTVTPATGGEVTISAYDSGAHSPKQCENADFQDLLDGLNTFDLPEIPLQSVQQTFNIKNNALRQQIKEQFEAARPSKIKDEQYCDYSFVFEIGKEKLVVKQYSSGKLQLQGHAGPLYRRTLEIIIPRYNLHFPNATLQITDYLASEKGRKAPAERPENSEGVVVILPHIGTDESGKGDYFGPLVIAAVWVDEPLQDSLSHLGVQDSKDLTDGRCRELAHEIRQKWPGKYEVVEISPDKYNELYDQFVREKRNLNHLLAWGHARAIESLLKRQDCSQAIADQFGDERYIASKLMEKGKALNLIQTPKAERFIAVAAASVLARDRFLSRLSQLSEEAGVRLPKGASPAVVEAATQIVQKRGVNALGKFAKLHFKTTLSVVGKR
jgi:ribonuclease HIII